MSTVQLAPQNLIGLHKPIELSGQILILNLQHMGMSLKRLLFLNEVIVTPLVLLVKTTLAFHIAPRHIQRLLFLFKTELGISQLQGAIAVSCLLEFDVSSQIEVFLSNPLVVSSQRRVLAAHSRVVVIKSRKLTLCVLKSHLFCA